MNYRNLLALLFTLLFGANLSAQKNVKRPDTYNYNRALEALKDDQFKTAMDYLDAELAEHPKNGYAYGWQSYIYNEHEMYEQALEKANKSIQFLPKKDTEFLATIYGGRAITYLALEDTISALADYKRAMALDPDEDYIYKHINILNEQGRFNEEKEDVELLIRNRPNNATANVYVGRYYFNIGDYDSAMRHYTHATKLAPDYSSSYSFRADVFMKQEKWREASEDVVQALAINGDQKGWSQMQYLADLAPTHIVTSLKTKELKEVDNHYWPYCLGIVSGIQKKHSEAIDYFKRAIEMSGYDESVEEQASYQLAKSYHKLAQYEDALNYINEAIRCDSTYARYFIERAQLNYDMGKTDLAIEDATSVIRIVPESAYGYVIRASYRLWGGYIRNAVDDLTTALTMDDTFATAYQYRATAYRKLGKESEALADLKAILALPDEDNEDSKAFAHAMLGHKLEAKEYAEKAFADKDDGAYYNLACIYSIMGESEKAIDALEQALVLGHHDFWHYAHDLDLDNIRELPRFKALMEEYKVNQESTSSSIETMGETTTTEVPFTKEAGVCKVKCTINDLPLNFYFDTGAYSVTLSNVEAAFMLKNGYLLKSDVKGSTYMGDANGDISEGTVVILRKVVFGGFTLENVKASIVHNQKAPLLLGQSVLSRLGKIEIDNANGLLKITHKK